MERWRRKRSHYRVASPLNFMTIVDRSSGDKLISSDRAQEEREQSGKERNFQRKLGSDSGSFSDGRTIVEDPCKLHLGKCSSGVSTGTAMKKLLAEEMSREVEAKRRSPNVIARLMGLDGFPQQKRASERCQQKMAPIGFHKSARSYDNQWCRKSPREQQMFKDVYEVTESSKIESSSLPSHVSFGRKQNEDEMDLVVRKKFMDAKRLSTDEKLQCSKEFIDALEVLDSNKDLLLKFLDGPDSFFARHLRNLHSSYEFHCGHVQSSKSSVLKHNMNAIGCREASPKIDICVSCKRQDGLNYPSSPGQVSSRVFSHSEAKMNDGASAIPTRIVVLKPNLVKMQNRAKCVSSFSSCDLFADYEVHQGNPSGRCAEAELWSKKSFPDDLDISGVESQESRELAKEITCRMKNELGSGSFNISLSKFRGYFADESSHDCSENDSSYESEASTVISHTPFHHSSRGKSSNSHCSESFANREAKKRLSERWKMTHRPHEVGLIGKGSTLGKMLAIPDFNGRPSNIETTICQDGLFGRFDRKDGRTGWIAPLGIRSKDGCKDASFGTLSRSRSVPSFNYLGSPKTSVGQEILSVERFMVPKESSSQGNKAIERNFRRKGSFSDFRRKEGSFSASVRTSNKKSESSLHINEAIIDVQEVQFGKNKKKSSIYEKNSPDVKDVISETLTRNRDASLNIDVMVDVEHERVPASMTSCDEQIPGPSSSDDMLPKDESCSSALHESMPKELSRRSSKDGLACSKLTTAQLVCPPSTKEADQPSPVSVLETPFVEDVFPGSECFERDGAELHGLRMQLQLLKLESEAYDGPNLISSDDHLGELSWGFQEERGLLGVAGIWESSYLFDVLATLELDSINPDVFNATWRSPESPVAPWVFERLEKKYSDAVTSSRSERRLLFDLINSGILEIFQQFTDPYRWVKHPMKTTYPRWHKDRFKVQLQKLLKSYRGAVTQSTVNPVLQRASQWLDLGDHIDAIGRDIGNLLIDELVAELITM